MSTIYPVLKKGTRLGCRADEFPLHGGFLLQEHRQYLMDHNIALAYSNNKFYETSLGFCFLLTGPELAYQERSLFSNPKCRNPIDVQLERYVFEIDNPDSPVVFVVEGPADVLAIAQHGYSAVGLLGANISIYKASEILTLSRIYFDNTAEPRPIIYLPDNDLPGLKFACTVGQYLPARIEFLPDSVKDVCDLTLDQQRAFLLGVVRRIAK